MGEEEDGVLCELVCFLEVVAGLLLCLSGGCGGEFFVDDFLYSVGDGQQCGGGFDASGLDVCGVVMGCEIGVHFSEAYGAWFCHGEIIGGFGAVSIPVWGLNDTLGVWNSGIEYVSCRVGVAGDTRKRKAQV